MSDSKQQLTKDNLEKAIDKSKDSSNTGSFEIELTKGKKADLKYIIKTDPKNKDKFFVGEGDLDKVVKIDIGTIVDKFSPNALSGDQWKWLSKTGVAYKYVVLACKRPHDGDNAWLVGVDLNLSAGDLSTLPVIGQFLKGAKLSLVEQFLLSYSTEDLTKADIEFINKQLPGGDDKKDNKKNAKKTKGSKDDDSKKDDKKDDDTKRFNIPKTAKKDTDTVLKQGFNFSSQVGFGDATPYTLVSSVISGISDGQDQGKDKKEDKKKDDSKTEITDPKAWYKLQKTLLGFLYVKQLGLQFHFPKPDKKTGKVSSDDPSTLSLLFDGGIHASGLKIDASNLGIVFPLDGTPVYPKLEELDVEYKKADTVEIAGALLISEATDKKTKKKYHKYAGKLKVAFKLKGKDFAGGAIGEYALPPSGDPYLFIYLFINFPIGGPPFFSVEGLSAGFGYNQKFTAPKIDKIPKFPLIAEVMGDDDDKDKQKKDKKKGKKKDKDDDDDGISGELKKLDKFIKPSPGDDFVSIGVKFSSFKMVECMALLTVAFGSSRFELDLLGLAKLTVPTPEEGKTITPLAELELALKATFNPIEGFLGIRAQLTSSSYILDKNCRPTGGFAFYGWFAGEHEGDFAITLGGYHPRFKAPKHYPTVPRLGINWHLDDTIVIKSEGYFALCPHALMAGGHMEASYKSGQAYANFMVDANFLMAWKPYHYDITAYVSIHAGYGWLGPIDVSANVHIWGPEFGGKAEIHVWPISFTVQFGDQSGTHPEPLEWKKFKKSFLPEDDKLCSLNVNGGLVQQLATDDKEPPAYVINAKELKISTGSMIPSKTLVKGTEAIDTLNADLSTAALLASADASESDQAGINTDFGIAAMAVAPTELETTHTVTITRNGQPAEADFHCEPTTKHVPTGLWGRKIKPDVNDKPVIKNTPSGMTITVKNPVKGPDQTKPIETNKLLTDLHEHSGNWSQINNFASIKTTATKEDLLHALGF